MAETLHIIASCADRKRSTGEEPLRLREFNARDPSQRLQQWCKALAKPAPRLPAQDLYVGQYWSSVRKLAVAPKNGRYRPELWVASAGYGLVNALQPLRPYSATFRTNEPDSVVRPSDQRRGFESKQWWRSLVRSRRPAKGIPRTVRELTAIGRRPRLMVVGSPGYVAAMEDDLLEALDELGDSDRLIIITGEPGPRPARLHASWIESGARLLAETGGTFPALHARVAVRILAESSKHGLDSGALRERWAAIAERNPDPMKPQRAAASDQEVKDFMRAMLAKDPKLKHTRLLRDFRESGRACEQSRFRNLFRELTKESGR